MKVYALMQQIRFQDGTALCFPRSLHDDKAGLVKAKEETGHDIAALGGCQLVAPDGSVGPTVSEYLEILGIKAVLLAEAEINVEGHLALPPSGRIVIPGRA